MVKVIIVFDSNTWNFCPKQNGGEPFFAYFARPLWGSANSLYGEIIERRRKQTDTVWGKMLMFRAGPTPRAFSPTHVRRRRSDQLSLQLAQTSDSRPLQFGDKVVLSEVSYLSVLTKQHTNISVILSKRKSFLLWKYLWALLLLHPPPPNTNNIRASLASDYTLSVFYWIMYIWAHISILCKHELFIIYESVVTNLFTAHCYVCYSFKYFDV